MLLPFRDSFLEIHLVHHKPHPNTNLRGGKHKHSGHQLRDANKCLQHRSASKFACDHIQEEAGDLEEARDQCANEAKAHDVLH